MGASWLGKVLKPDPEAIAAAFGKLEKYLAPESDRAERRRVDQFAAYRWDGTALIQDTVRDISSSGLYLVTNQRWQPGAVLALTLQREGPMDPDPARRITTQVKVVRCGTDGVGLSFLWAKDDPESRQWDALLEALAAQTKPSDMQSLARMVEGFAFLSQICSAGAEEIGEWVRTRASSHKVLNAVAIALKAKGLMGDSLVGDFRVSPVVAVRILELGSATEEDWLHRFWAGLLVSAMSGDGRQKTNLEFVELFSQLTSIPARIFTVVCTKANKMLSDSGDVSAEPLACKTDELASVVGARGPQMERDLQALAGLQLIDKRKATNGPALLASTETWITPTSLGLELFARCNGHRGSVQDFYFVTSPQAAGGSLTV